MDNFEEYLKNYYEAVDKDMPTADDVKVCKICGEVVSQSIKRHVEYKHDISISDYLIKYWNKTCYGSERPRCLYCGEYLEFKTMKKFPWPYGTYCNHSHFVSHKNLLAWQDPDYRDHMTKVLREVNPKIEDMIDDRIYQGLISRTYRGELYRCNNITEEYRYFYIAYFDGGFKVGLCSESNTATPEGYFTEYLFEGYDALDIYKGNKYEVTELEYYIKKNSHRYLWTFDRSERGSTEIFTEEAIPILSDFFNKYSLNYEYTIIKDNGTIRKTDNRFRPLDS